MRIRFSATSLQDYVDCPRRFQLRYVLELPWPALDTTTPGDQEQRARLGHDLHRMIHQHLADLPVASPAAAPAESPLPGWWQAYLKFAAQWQNWRIVPEVALSAPIAGQRISVRYDALAWPRQEDAPGPSCVILEWKTFRHLPTRAWLRGRLQSRVYPWALARAGCASPTLECPVASGALEMRYWLAGPPARVERFVYSRTALESDAAYLEGLVTQIKQRTDADSVSGSEGNTWELTERRQLCELCVYRSLCGRCASGRVPVDQYEEDAHLDGTPTEEMDADSAWSQVQEMVF